MPETARRLAGAILLLAILAAALACLAEPPTQAPSPPQQTAGALNATYAAGTQTAHPSPTPTLTPSAAPSPTSTPMPSLTPSLTLTSSIVEVTATRTIIEVTPGRGIAAENR